MTRRRIDPQRPFADEARRLLQNDLTAIAAGLAHAREHRDEGLHDARKAIKKARALLKLLRTADEPFYAVENTRLRDLSRSFADARNAASLVEAVERLRLAHPDHAKALIALKARLELRRDAHVIDGDVLGGRIEEGLVCVEQMRLDMDRWQLPAEPDAAAIVLAAGMKANLRRAKRALKRAEDQAQDKDFHDLRKAVKAHWTQLGLLRELWPQRVKKKRARLEELGERLGEHNDLAALVLLLRSRELDLTTSRSKRLRRISAKTRAVLAHSTTKSARRLVGSPPKHLESTFVERLQADGKLAAAAESAPSGRPM